MHFLNNLKKLTKHSTIVKILLSLQIFTLFFIPELFVITTLSQRLGKFSTIALVLAISGFGLLIVTGSVANGMHTIRQSNNVRTPTSKQIAALIAILLGGVLIITPGIIGSLCGYIIVYTPLRKVLIYCILTFKPRWVELASYYYKLD